MTHIHIWSNLPANLASNELWTADSLSISVSFEAEKKWQEINNYSLIIVSGESISGNTWKEEYDTWKEEYEI